jgi:hypothetical protein
MGDSDEQPRKKGAKQQQYSKIGLRKKIKPTEPPAVKIPQGKLLGFPSRCHIQS